MSSTRELERVRPDEIDIVGDAPTTLRVSESYRERIQTRQDDEWEGLTEEEIERWLSGTTDWGVETTEEEIDEILYGSPDEFENGDE